MMWNDEQESNEQKKNQFNFDLQSLLSKPHNDYYKVLEVDSDATDDAIRSNYIRLALKWHPDKRKQQQLKDDDDDDDVSSTSFFQLINEAYTVLSDPVKRSEHDKNGGINDYKIISEEYLNRYKGIILTCNGLGMKHSMW